MVFVHSLEYLLSTEAGPLTEQMHENRPTSVSEVQNKEAESSSSHTVTDKQQSQVLTFFGCWNRFYSLFSASPERWGILKSKTGCSLQRLSETRWSARIAAVKPVANHLPSIIKALDTILAKCNLTNEARSEASGLKQYFMSFKAIFLLTVWKKILQSIEDRNLILQSGKIPMEVEISNIQALTEEMEVLRNSWDNLFSEASLIAEAMEMPRGFPVSHKGRRKWFCRWKSEFRGH